MKQKDRTWVMAIILVAAYAGAIEVLSALTGSWFWTPAIVVFSVFVIVFLIGKPKNSNGENN